MNKEEIKSEDSIFSDPEPWEAWESSLVVWCIGIGVISLIILGWLVNSFILD